MHPLLWHSSSPSSALHAFVPHNSIGNLVHSVSPTNFPGCFSLKSKVQLCLFDLAFGPVRPYL